MTACGILLLVFSQLQYQYFETPSVVTFPVPNIIFVALFPFQTFSAPASDYKTVREKLAQEKRNSRKALSTLLSKTRPSHPIAGTSDPSGLYTGVGSTYTSPKHTHTHTHTTTTSSTSCPYISIFCTKGPQNIGHYESHHFVSLQRLYIH